MASSNATEQTETPAGSGGAADGQAAAAAPAQDDGRTAVTLPVSGRTARVRQALGKDSIAAGRLLSMGDSANMMAQQMAIVAQCTRVDGEPVTFEDIQEWPLQDVYALMPAALSGGKSVSSVVETLLGSSSPPDSTSDGSNGSR